MKSVTVYLLIYLLWLPLWTSAQTMDLHFSHFGTHEGLPNQSIQCLYQDRLGYLWIGTWDGLSRYDGYAFANYQREVFDTTTLSANDVKAITEDRNGDLWVGSQGGLSRYHRQTDNFTQITPPAAVSPSWAVYNMVCDSSGAILLGQRMGSAILWRQREGTSLQIAWRSRTSCLYAERDQIWLGKADGGLDLLATDADTMRSLLDQHPGLKAFGSKKLLSIIKDRSGRYYLGTTDGLYQYHNGQLSALHDRLLSDRVVISLLEDREGRIWVGTDNGLYCFAEDQHLLGHYLPDPLSLGSLRDKIILSLLEDRAGNLWVGTFQGGLHKVSLGFRPRFHAYRSAHFRAHNLTVFAFAEGADNRLWVGTSEGLYLLDKHTKAVRAHYGQGAASEGGLPARDVMSVLETADEQVLIGFGNSQGVTVLDWPSQRIIRQSRDVRLATIRKIVPLHYPRHAVLLVGSSCTYFFPSSGELRPLSYRLPPGEPGLPSYSWDAYQAPDSTLWIANKRGLLHIAADSGEGRFYPLFPDYYRADNTVISIQGVEDSCLWLGTYGAGLLQVDLEGQMLQHYSRADGLPNDFVIGVIPDGEGHLWLSTNLGISRFDTVAGIFQNFRERDGLMGEEFATGAYLQTAEGEIFMGGSNGFVAFYPWQIEAKASRFRPPLYLSDLRVSAPPLRQDEAGLHFTAYTGQRLDLSFVALDYTDPDKILYQWQLEGWEDQWQYPVPERKVSYTNLPPGHYVFKLRSSNSDGVFGGKSLYLPIEVMPRLDQRWEFRLGLVLLLLFSIGGLLYRYVKRLRTSERYKLEHRIAETRQEALASQMDQHFLFNSLNSIQRFVMENQPKEAVRFISRFGKLIRLQLQQARQNLVSLDEELQTLDLYLSLEQLRTHHKFTYQIQIDPALDPYNIEMPPGLLQPYLENAIWHGLMPKPQAGKLLLSVVPQDHGYLFSVEDNGIGRAAAQQSRAASHPGKGMLITRERIETHNALHNTALALEVEDIVDHSGNPSGTRVKLFVPF